MARKLKVYWADTYVPGVRSQGRLLACAPSRAALGRILEEHGMHYSRGELSRYWMETGNDVDVATATTEGDVFWAADGPGAKWRRFYARPRSLKQIAKYINDNWPDYEAEIVEGFCSTDRKIAGTRLRAPGKGRRGNQLLVRRKLDRKVIYSHNSAETYRKNAEVEDWIRTVESGSLLP